VGDTLVRGCVDLGYVYVLDFGLEFSVAQNYGILKKTLISI